MSDRLVMLASDGESTNIIFNALDKEFGVDTVVIEEPESRRKFLTRRLRRLGVATVVGQLLFQGLMMPGLRAASSNRIDDIKKSYGLDDSPIQAEKIHDVESVNQPAVAELLQRLNPKLVVINGTRIISGKVLDAIEAPFINMHAGITPAYRGVHGGYWALANGEPTRCGVTVHRLDEGIDTGAVLAQTSISPEASDNFTTYPYLQIAEGLPLLVHHVRRGLDGELEETEVPGEDSNLWYHPTLPGYLFRRIVRGVR